MALQFTMEDQFDASPEEVIGVITDIEGYGNWMPNFVRVEKVTQGAFGEGTVFRETRKMFGKEATEHFEVTAFEPGKCVELLVDGAKGSTGRGEYRFRYTFESYDAGTKMRMHAEISGMGTFMSLLGRLFLGGFKKALAKDNQAIKAFLQRQKAA